jgi:hypothetical protein
VYRKGLANRASSKTRRFRVLQKPPHRRLIQRVGKMPQVSAIAIRCNFCCCKTIG